MPLKLSPPFPGHLIVHVGDHKTGTTSIQVALARGDVILKSGRLSYPLIGNRFNHNHLGINTPRRKLLELARSGKPKTAGPGFVQVANRARHSNPDVTVISAEVLEKAPPTKLHDALAEAFPLAPGKLSVVSYLRPHTGRAMSGMAETIKVGRSKPDPWSGFGLKIKVQLRYASRIAAWRKVFGAAYQPRPMIRGELVNGSVIEDLFATALGPDRVTLRDSRRVNEALGVEDLMRLHVLHLALPKLTRIEHHGLGWALADHMNATRTPDATVTPLRIHKALAEDLRKALLVDAKKIDADICGGRPLFADEFDRAVDTAVPEQMSLAPSDWLADTEIQTLKATAKLIGEICSVAGWQRALNLERIKRMLE